MPLPLYHTVRDVQGNKGSERKGAEGTLPEVAATGAGRAAQAEPWRLRATRQARMSRAGAMAVHTELAAGYGAGRRRFQTTSVKYGVREWGVMGECCCERECGRERAQEIVVRGLFATFLRTFGRAQLNHGIRLVVVRFSTSFMQA
jgi:hypothetical protein